MNTWEITHINGVCTKCNGSGTKILHRAGDPVEGFIQDEKSTTVYLSTSYVTCDCCMIKGSLMSTSKY